MTTVQMFKNMFITDIEFCQIQYSEGLFLIRLPVRRTLIEVIKRKNQAF
jgi:hypothetical protein